MTVSRVPGIDAIRVLGIAAVVFGHVYTGPLTHQWIYAWHVPIFFVLTGYLWTPHRALARELRSRLKSLAVPYLSWFVVISLVFLTVVSLTSGLDWGPVRNALWGGAAAAGPFGTFWFVSVLLVTSVLYRIVERLPLLAQWSIAVAGVILATFQGPLLSATFLGVGLALPCLIFVLAGRALRVLEARVTRPIALGVALLCASAALIVFLPQASIDLKAGQLGVPVFGVLIAVAVSAGLLLLARQVKLSGVVAQVAVALGSVGIAVVLSHPVVLWVLRTGDVQPKWILLAAIVLPWAFAVLVNRTRLSPFLIGAPTKKPRAAEVVTSRVDLSRQ